MDPIYCEIFEPVEWIRYIAIYFNLPSEYDTWPANKPPIYLQKSFISNSYTNLDCLSHDLASLQEPSGAKIFESKTKTQVSAQEEL